VSIFTKRKPPLCGIYSENEFRALLAHERKRADRTGDEFSIALFDVPNSDGDINNACFLPDLITDVVRSTDEVGWLDKDHIGVLLVDGKNNVAFKEMIRKDIAYEQERYLQMDINIV
jgi:PleD family two-component response regulator